MGVGVGVVDGDDSNDDGGVGVIVVGRMISMIDGGDNEMISMTMVALAAN